MATKSKKSKAQVLDDAESVISASVHDATACDVDDDETFFQDIDLLQNHGIVSFGYFKVLSS